MDATINLVMHCRTFVHVADKKCGPNVSLDGSPDGSPDGSLDSCRAQVRLDQVRLDQVRLDQVRLTHARFTQAALQ